MTITHATLVQLLVVIGMLFGLVCGTPSNYLGCFPLSAISVGTYDEGSERPLNPGYNVGPCSEYCYGARFPIYGVSIRKLGSSPNQGDPICYCAGTAPDQSQVASDDRCTEVTGYSCSASTPSDECGSVTHDFGNVYVALYEEFFFDGPTYTPEPSCFSDCPTQGTQAPSTQPPGTQPPGTQPPGTQPPSTQPPGTQPPTAEPATTAALTTVPPTTVPATTTAHVTTSAPATTTAPVITTAATVKSTTTTTRPMTAKPSTVKPTTVKPTPKPTTSKPTTVKPTPKPTTHKPTTHKPTTHAPTVGVTCAAGHKLCHHKCFDPVHERCCINSKTPIKSIHATC